MGGRAASQVVDACLVDARCEVSEQLPGRRMTFGLAGNDNMAFYHERASSAKFTTRLEAAFDCAVGYDTIPRQES